MKKKSTNYSTPDGGGWMHVCDDLFLAQFLGRPCEICGKTSTFWCGKTVRSHGHHLLPKKNHRLYRYDKENILVLCSEHHLGGDIAPHSHDTAAQTAFSLWLQDIHPEKLTLMMGRKKHKFNKEWCYRDMYAVIGGAIHSKTGKLKDMRPKGHAAKVREAEG